jgi:hypothetical protein
MVSVLMAPYFGFVLYYSRRFPSNQWPTWFTNTIAIWFIANFVAVMLLMRLTRKIFGNQVVDVERATSLAQKAIRTSARLVISGVYCSSTESCRQYEERFHWSAQFRQALSCYFSEASSVGVYTVRNGGRA